LCVKNENTSEIAAVIPPAIPTQNLKSAQYGDLIGSAGARDCARALPVMFFAGSVAVDSTCVGLDAFDEVGGRAVPREDDEAASLASDAGASCAVLKSGKQNSITALRQMTDARCILWQRVMVLRPYQDSELCLMSS
jgi:hypothetical protein